MRPKGRIHLKIAVPSDDKNMDSAVCLSFGRAPYFVFYDTDTKKVEYVENDAAAKRGGAGIRAAQMVADSGADVIITPRCGENAEEVLRESNVAVYKSITASVKENIDALAQGRLEPLQDIHPGFHGHGG